MRSFAEETHAALVTDHRAAQPGHAETRRRRRRATARAHLLTALAATALLVAACRSSRAADSVVVHASSGETIPVEVELATTPQTRQLGLMYRKSLDPGSGMLFVFPHAAPQSFWMKNTPLPLDILFLDDAGRIVRMHRRTTPFSEASLPSGAPVRFVLEVQGGFAERHGVREGDVVELGELARTPVR